MEDTRSNSEYNSEVMYSARDLAEMHLPGLPDTERAWLDRAKNGGWKFREVPGRGRGGIKRIYLPPPEVMALIEARQRGELPPAPARSPVQAVTPPAPYPLSSGTGEQLDQRLAWAEATIRLAYIVRSYPKFAKVSGDLLQRVSLLAFRLVFLFCDGDLKRINQWLDDSRKADGIVRMAYEGDCIKRGVVPGADLDI